MLELLLNRYAAIAAVGEVDQLPLQIVRDGVRTRWVGLCSCNKRPEECDVWRAVYDGALSEMGIDLAKNPFAFALSDVGLAQEFGLNRPLDYLKLVWHRVVRALPYRLVARFPGVFPYRKWVHRRELVYRVIAEQRGVSTIVDASKDALQMFDLLHYAELPVKVLFLTRDVRGNVWSAIRRKNASATLEAKNWVSVNRKIYSKLQRAPKSSWMHVKYEDLCGDTNATLDRILRFLEIDGLPVSPTEEQARRHTIAGNQVRFAALESIRHDLSWKENLSKAQMAEIRKIAGPMALALNYEI
jgi:hypothetical protein